jgi:nitrite reductase/ring-hydroxylating ferredoxin subunit
VKPPRAESLDEVPGAPPFGSVLCRLGDLPVRGSKSFQFRDGRLRFDIFIQRWDDKVYAYRDACPHLKLPLDWRRGHFLDIEGQNIQCGHHGARFRVQDGLCIDGPCKGEYLTPVRIVVRGDEILVA